MAQQYDFDREICRRGTASTKWEFIPNQDHTAFTYGDACFGEKRLLPMWVADMDFASPQPVIDALKARAEHGLYGYTAPTPDFYQAVRGWMKRRHNWDVEDEWLTVTPGVVPAIYLMVYAYTEPGDSVLIQPPVYHPFYHAIKNTGRNVVRNPLKVENGRYLMDFDDLARKAADPSVKMVILSNPHNPVGRVWDREELRRFGEICMANDVLVVADEIHCDLVYSGVEFPAYATLGEEFANSAILCHAPSKTFNLAGLKTSTIFIPNEKLRQTFLDWQVRLAMKGLSAFGAVGLEAAYNHGEPWLAELMAYLEGNLEYLDRFLRDELPQVTMTRPEGTYLVWLDFRRLGLDRDELHSLMAERARVLFDDGYIFGREGEGFQRINIACPHSVLAEVMARVKAAVAAVAAVPA